MERVYGLIHHCDSIFRSADSKQHAEQTRKLEDNRQSSDNEAVPQLRMQRIDDARMLQLDVQKWSC